MIFASFVIIILNLSHASEIHKSDLNCKISIIKTGEKEVLSEQNASQGNSKSDLGTKSDPDPTSYSWKHFPNSNEVLLSIENKWGTGALLAKLDLNESAGILYTHDEHRGLTINCSLIGKPKAIAPKVTKFICEQFDGNDKFLGSYHDTVNARLTRIGPKNEAPIALYIADQEKMIFNQELFDTVKPNISAQLISSTSKGLGHFKLTKQGKLTKSIKCWHER